jgi:disulfide bond formation protein DsbB
MNMSKIFDLFLIPRNLALFVALVSIAALGSALIMEHGFDINPCHLCLMQRKPYWATIPLGLIAFFTAKTSPRLTFWLLLAAGTAFLVNMGISFFHTGVELKWWPLPGGCEGSLPENPTIEELKEYYKHHVKPVNCGQPGFVFLGISLTQYNFLLSTFMTGFTFINAFQGRNNGKAAPKA